MMIRRIKRQVLISFDNEKEAKGFSAFMIKRNQNASFIELMDNYEKDGMCDKHKIGWLGKAFPFGCPNCNIDVYRKFGYNIVKLNNRWCIIPKKVN